MRRSFLLAFGILAVPVVVFLAAVTAFDWQRDAQRRATADALEATLPLLGQVHVRTVERNGRCYSIGVGPGTVHLFPDGASCDPGSPVAVPATDLPAEIADLVDRLEHGPDFTAIRVTDRTGETVGGAEVDTGSCDTYVYLPGWTELPDDDSISVVPIDADWYLLAC